MLKTKIVSLLLQLCSVHLILNKLFGPFQIWGDLKKNFGRVIAVDMLGHGFSDKPVSFVLIPDVLL